VTSTGTPTPTCGPGSDYLISQSTGAAIVPGATDTGNHCDDCVTTIGLPFPVQLYGSSYTQVTASSNGNLQFDSADAAYGNVCLPAATFNNAILAHWDDLRTDGSGNGIFSSISGSAPNRVFNIEWRTVYYGTTQAANFEARLYEGQDRFDVVYGQVEQGGSSATVGMQRGTGGSFTQFECNTAGALFAGLQITFYAAPCPTYTPTTTRTGTATPTATCAPASGDVSIQQFLFVPQSITVSAG